MNRKKTDKQTRFSLNGQPFIHSILFHSIHNINSNIHRPSYLLSEKKAQLFFPSFFSLSKLIIIRKIVCVWCVYRGLGSFFFVRMGGGAQFYYRSKNNEFFFVIVTVAGFGMLLMLEAMINVDDGHRFYTHICTKSKGHNT